MGGGLMQLVAMGAQDVFLTGNPQITFFKVVYRRHTNFSKECIRQEFSGSGAFGSSLTCTLSRNGDLVQEIYLNTTFSAIAQQHDGSAVCAVTAADATTLGDLTKLVKSVEVEIGGQKIDKHYGPWLDIYNELFETNHDYSKNMVGGASTAVPAAAAAAATVSQELFIPLRFWFNRNPGLALPLIALQYHEVKVKVDLENFANLNDVVTFESKAGTGQKMTASVITAPATLAVPTAVAGGANSDQPSTHAAVSMTSPQLLVNYVYLDTDERRRFAQVSHEYLIEQVQHTGADSGTAITLTYNHPVKALFWTAGTSYSAAKLQLNGHDRFSEQNKKYFNLVQPYESGLGNGHVLDSSNRTWGVVSTGGANTSVYSFCLKPAEHQPSGSCNFSRIDNARLNLTGNGTDTAMVFALNYNVLRIMSGMGGLTYSN